MIYRQAASARHSDDVRLLSDAELERVDYRELHRAYVRDGDVASRYIWQVLASRVSARQ